MAKNEGGRPRKEIDLEDLRRAVEIHCTQEECAHLFDMTADTLSERLKEYGYEGFSDFYKKHQSEGKRSLRRAQWEAATEDKNPTMLVWLGKQYLGQKDSQEVELKQAQPFTGLLIERADKVPTD